MSRVFLYKIFEPLGIDSNRVEKDSEAEILLASQDIKSFSLLSLHTVVPPSNVAPKAAPSVNLNNSSPTSSKNLSPTAASLPLPSTPPLSHHYSILAQRISDNAVGFLLLPILKTISLTTFTMIFQNICSNRSTQLHTSSPLHRLSSTAA